MLAQDRVSQRVVVAVRTLRSHAEVLADACRKVVEEENVCLCVDELEKKRRGPLAELPLPRGGETGPRQLNGSLPIHERTPGENRERRKIRTPEAVSFTAQESDQLPVMPGLRSRSRAHDGRRGGVKGGKEQQCLLSEVPGNRRPGQCHQTSGLLTEILAVGFKIDL